MEVYKRNNKEVIIDGIRKIFVPLTAEEIVRQKSVHSLIEDRGFPPTLMDTEYSISKTVKRKRGRVDIVVWEEFREKALLVIETKAPDVSVTAQVLEQAMRYGQLLNARYIIITNGNEEETYEICDQPKLIENGLNYSEMLNNLNIKYIEETQIDRYTYETTTSDEYIEDLINEGTIAESTPKALYPIISELENFLLCEEFTFDSPINYNGIIIKKDLGYTYREYSNSSGGAYDGYYRGILINDLSCEDQIIHLTIIGSAKTVNDPVYGNRRGTTGLHIGMHDYNLKHHNALQMNLDDTIKLNIDRVDFLHKGDMSVGNRGAIKRKIIFDYIRDLAPMLISECGNYVYLGSLPLNKSLAFADGKEFLCKLILYSAIREKIKRMIQVNST